MVKNKRKEKLCAVLSIFLAFASALLSINWWLPKGVWINFDYESSAHIEYQIFYCENNISWKDSAYVKEKTTKGKGKAHIFLPSEHIDRLRIDVGIKPGVVTLSHLQLEGVRSVNINTNPAKWRTVNVSSLKQVDGKMRIESNHADPYLIYKENVDLKGKRGNVLWFHLFIAVMAPVYIMQIVLKTYFFSVEGKGINQMSTIKPAITHSVGEIIKGIALILMVIHHCYGFPEWLIPGVEITVHPELREWAFVFKFCVCIYAFLTGWTYFHHKDKSCAYSFKKIIAILVDYGVVVIFTALVAVIFCQYTITFDTIIPEILPFRGHQPLMIFAWYIGFYVVVILLLPYVSLICARRMSLANIVLVSVLLFACFWMLKLAKVDANWRWFLPCVLSGYLCAQFQVVEIVKDFLSKCSCKLISGVLFAVGSIWLYRYCGRIFLGVVNAGTLYALLFCIGIVLLSSVIEKIRIAGILKFIGRHGLNIWLLHGIFYSPVTKNVFQPVAYLFDTPLYTIPFVIGLCLLISFILKPIQAVVSKFVLNGVFMNNGTGSIKEK